MTINTKTSSAISDQLPFFVRDQHPTFIAFLEAYYEFLEQDKAILSQGQVTNRAKSLPALKDIDSTIDAFADKLYKKFLDSFPVNTLADRDTILKHAKDFYRAKGTEKSYKFLMRALYGKELDFYYPKKDVLKFSDGKWYIQKSLRIQDTQINGTSNTNINGLSLYINRQITGNVSNASAIVESIDRYFTNGVQIDELVLSSIVGTFSSGEPIFTSFSANGNPYVLSSNIISSIIYSVTLDSPGLGYHIGDPVVVLSTTGNGACVVVGTVTSGNITSILVGADGGAGYRANDYLLFSSDTGSGANGYLSAVNTDQSVHPNTYNIWMSLISYEANTPINNTTYSNLNPAITDPANNWIQNVLSRMIYSNTGPASIVAISVPGSGYETVPTISVLANTRIQELGVLGRMNVVNGGTGYGVGDVITITNIPGGGGVGGIANVKTVAANGQILTVQFTNMTGHITGGAGYDINYMPVANVVNTLGTGHNANIVVTELLGTGGVFTPQNSTIGTIETLRIISPGRNFISTPTLDLSGSGDGTAKASATIISGVFTYPGRYLNDDGHLSSFNFIQDRDYYQNYSYVIRVKQSIDDYRKAFKELVHPVGMKMFGEYIEEDENQGLDNHVNTPTESVIIFNTGTYSAANTLNVNYAAHNVNANASVYLEFTSGNLAAALANGMYTVKQVMNANSFSVNIGSATYVTTSGNVYLGRILS